MINDLDNVDFIPSNVQSSHQEALWYVFEDNEAVIKMMIKGRSLVMMEDRTGRLVVTAQHTDRFIVENEKMNSYTEAESELSLESRSFSHRVNDQVRRKQKPILKGCNERQRQTFCDMENVYVFYIGIICIDGEELLRQLAFHQKYKRFHNETDLRQI